MANPRTLSRSFGGGEITPELYGRVDLAKFQTGLALCRNFIILPHGPAANRPGTVFVREVKNSAPARVIPFTYSSTQTMVIEIGAGYFRFHTQGATLFSGGVPYEVANGYAAVDLMDIHYVQSADVLTLTHPNYPIQELRRISATVWTLTPVALAATLAAPLNVSAGAAVATGANFVVYDYVVTAVADTTRDESLASTLSAPAPIAITAATQANPGLITLATGHGAVIGNPVTIAGVGGMGALNGSYLVNSTPAANQLTLKTLGGTPVDTTAYGAYTSGGTAQFSILLNNLSISGNRNTISWSAVAGAVRYNVYKRVNSSGVFGYIGQTDSTSFVDDNITADLSRTPSIVDSTLNGGASDYPGAVSYYEQRRVFAGSINRPQNVWGTKSGTESNLNYSIPVRDDDRIAFRIAAREASSIRHIVPLTNLILLTASAEWRVTSVNSDALTPSSISVKPQSFNGANNVQPVTVNTSLLYGAARGGRVRELKYDWQANGYVSQDASIIAPHLFDYYSVLDMAFAKAPNPILWCVSSTGKLLGMTYVPEQQVMAWHQHDTFNGAFESVAVVAEGNEDVLYAIVRRTIGNATKRYVERLASRQFVSQADAFFVDCGLTYSGVPATVISGFNHLEGQTISLLVDGAVQAPRKVVGGAVTLDTAGSKVQGGLPITADLQTLPLVLEAAMAGGQGRPKNINAAWLRVINSGGMKVGPSLDRLVASKQRTNEPYGTPTALVSKEVQFVIEPSWTDGGQVFVRQDQPLPCTVVSLTLEAAPGG